MCFGRPGETRPGNAQILFLTPTPVASDARWENAQELIPGISIRGPLFDRGYVLCDLVAASRDALEVIQIEVGKRADGPC
jgi:hypothetical protein